MDFFPKILKAPSARLTISSRLSSVDARIPSKTLNSMSRRNSGCAKNASISLAEHSSQKYLSLMNFNICSFGCELLTLQRASLRVSSADGAKALQLVTSRMLSFLPLPINNRLSRRGSMGFNFFFLLIIPGYMGCVGSSRKTPEESL